jgi:hypothetical protein
MVSPLSLLEKALIRTYKKAFAKSFLDYRSKRNLQKRFMKEA